MNCWFSSGTFILFYILIFPKPFRFLFLTNVCGEILSTAQVGRCKLLSKEGMRQCFVHHNHNVQSKGMYVLSAMFKLSISMIF